MLLSRFYFLLKIFLLFLFALLGEYFLCSIYFRFIRNVDFVRVDLICAFLGLVSLAFSRFKKIVREGRKENIHWSVILALYLIASALLGFSFRFSVQLANGLLDFSPPESHVIIVEDKKISSFGGSLREGMNPIAHMIYFHDWENSALKCEMLTPLQDFYYAVDPGSRVGLTIRRGLFHLAWVEDYQILNNRLNGFQFQ